MRPSPDSFPFPRKSLPLQPFFKNRDDYATGFVQGAIQEDVAAGGPGDAVAGGRVGRAVVRQRHGGPARGVAAGGGVVWRERVFHGVHFHHGAGLGAYAARGRAVRAGAGRGGGPVFPELVRAVRRGGAGGVRCAARARAAHVPHGATARGGGHGHPVLPLAGVVHPALHGLLQLQAVPRRRGQHHGEHGHHRHGQPHQHLLQLAVHLRPLGMPPDGSGGGGLRHLHLAGVHAGIRPGGIRIGTQVQGLPPALPGAALQLEAPAVAAAHGRAHRPANAHGRGGLRADFHHDGLS